MTTFCTYDDARRIPPHTCCGARISIGAYGDWHLCEGCEAELACRHTRRRQAAMTGKESPSAAFTAATVATSPAAFARRRGAGRGAASRHA